MAKKAAATKAKIVPKVTKTISKKKKTFKKAPSTEKQVKLVCSDGEVIVDVSVAQQSISIKDTLEENLDEPVKLDEISVSVMNKTMAFCEHIKNKVMPEIEKPLRRDLREVVGPWFAKYIEVD